MSEKWLTGTVIENRHWTETLFSLRVEGATLGFEAGQFVRIALDIKGERVARAFSFVNPPQDPALEFYGVIVPEGPLSPRLAKLRAGDALQVEVGWNTVSPYSRTKASHSSSLCTFGPGSSSAVT